LLPASTTLGRQALTVAVRGADDSSAISPKTWPGPSTASASSPIPGTSRLMRTLPSTMTYNWSPESPSWNSTAPRRSRLSVIEARSAATASSSRALKSGASAYVTKDTAPQELATAIKTVLAGRQYVTPTLAERLEAMPLHAAGKPLHTLLSDRELQVLSMIGGGKSVTEIAVALDLSVKTVSTYRMRLLSKLQLKTTSALIRYALTHHL